MSSLSSNKKFSAVFIILASLLSIALNKISFATLLLEKSFSILLKSSSASFIALV